MSILDQSATGTAPTPGQTPTPTAAPTAPAAAAPKAKTPLDPILQKVQDDLEAKLPPALKQAVAQIVAAGMKALYDPSTRQKVMKAYKDAGNDPKKIATGILNLLIVVLQSSGGKAQKEGLYPAGIVLMTYVLDDLSKMFGLQITQPLVKAVGAQLAQLFVTTFKIKLAKPQGAPAAGPAAAPPAAPPKPGILGAAA